MEELVREINDIVHRAVETTLTKRFGEIKTENYTSIEERSSEKILCFIDGGNNELIATPSFSLQFVRTASIQFKKNERIKENINEAYCLAEIKKDKIVCKFFPVKGNIFGEIEIKENVPISKAVEYARRICELRTIEKESDNLEKGDIIILDGSLQPTFLKDEEMIKKLEELSDKKEILISSLVKTNRIITEEGNDLLPLLSQKSPEGSWFLSKENMAFVKLHIRSEHIFRYEILKKQKETIDLKKVMGVLSSNSKDPLFKGYPYGLIVADKRAKVSNEELSYFKTKILTKTDFKSLNPHLSSLNAHDILDTIS